jgi:ATP-dependent DNA helicase RecG
MPSASPVAAPRRPQLALDTPVQFLPGVGPARAALLSRLGITSLERLLTHVPRDYVDARRVAPIARLPRAGEGPVTVVGKIVASEVRTAHGRSDLRLRIADATGMLGATWYGQGFLGKALPVGATVALVGELAPGPGIGFVNPIYELVDEAAAVKGRMIPRYALTAGVSARLLTGWIRAALAGVGPDLDATDPLPEAVRARLGFSPRGQALRAAHDPASPEEAERARRRLAFEELFLSQLVLALRRRSRAHQAAALSTARGAARARAVIGALPFTATAAQKKVVNEIVRDMQAPRSMHRLLVGDVGSGKTVVALLAAACAIEAGFQVAVMAPTEILAEQHFRTLAALGKAAGNAPALWTGSTGAAARRDLRKRLLLPAGARGALDLLVGTHALLEDEVPLPRLGLVVVDEQHRFGVRQRAQLAKKGAGFPDVLVMTATPIPRSLALAWFGDLDVSVIDELPKDRQPIATRVGDEKKREELYAFMAKELAKGRQAYVVAPRIEESEASDLRAAKVLVESLAKHPALARFRFGLLHGKMKPAEKEAVMRAFGGGDLDALVATTVIEVGVDVPNATLMVVEHAERFGLTQLHQLRGRVGRGAARSVCVLMAGPRATPEARTRLALLARTSDGIQLAEEDLKTRGPGELWGTRQTGLPGFRIADFAKDEDLIAPARTAAEGVVADDPELALPAHRALRAALVSTYAEELSWRATG